MLTRRDLIGTIAAGSLAGASSLLFASGAQAFAEEAPADTSAPQMAGMPPFAKPVTTTQADLASSPKRVLIVVDYQVDFVDGGVFGRIEPAVAIEQALYEKVKEYQDSGDVVIYTMDTHPSDAYADTREGQFNPPHCIPGTPGWEVYGSLRSLLTPQRAIQILKGTYGSPDLPYAIKLIESQGTRIEYIEFAGVSTTCRVLHNAIIVFNSFPELPMVFDERTTASYTDERTRAQLDELEAWGFYVRRRS
ncbi:MAG: isochorismatase family protein [Eggerthellaceae bacterium]|nr:isochorismatase family protein [Eggerthellaceae bacterium]